MALDELERKLNESFNDLRTENKNLISLLKLRQEQLKETLSSTGTCQNEHSLNLPGGSLLRSLNQKSLRRGEKTESENTLVFSSDTGSSKAREMLSKHSWNGVNNNPIQSFRAEEIYLSSDDESQALTSTPNVTPVKSTKQKSSPKSILKRRKLIDDNVKVYSKFPHTPNYTESAATKGKLNFSYSEEQYPTRYSEDLDGSFVKEFEEKCDIPSLEHRANQKKLEDDIQKIDNLMGQNLLQAPGNDRQNANVVKNIDQRPKNSLFDINDKENSNDRTGKILMGKKTSPYNSQMNPTRDGRPLLGYDWIACVLENEGLLNEQTEGMFNEVKEFRKKNREECVGTAATWDKNVEIRRPLSPEIDDPGHTCIHGFTLNDRLFTSSINLNEEGKSICPVCLVARRPPTKEDPAFVRVSIPRSTIDAPYKVKPHTRKSFDPTDTYALSQHCLAGWKNAKPYTLPTASTLDLKDKIIPKQTTTYDEARQVAESFSRMGRLYQGKTVSEDKIAKELMSRTNSLRYELDMMKDALGRNKLNKVTKMC